jgi:ribosomal protein L11 methyltransferase
MEWLQVRVNVGSELAEAVAEVLARFAPRGVVIEAGPEGATATQVAVYAYLPADETLATTRRKVEESLWHLSQIAPIPDPEFTNIAEADWASEWKKQLRVLHIGQRTVIRPSWLPYTARKGEVVIELDPGMAFGTGMHPTTQMCLMSLERHSRPEMQILDLGTGSGILAIAGAKLGASSVLALDTDPQAVQVARQNARLNTVADQVKVSQGSIAQAKGPYDLVMVNILAKVIIQMAGQGLADLITPDSLVVIAGLILDQEEEVTAELARSGLVVSKRQQIEDWVSLEMSRVAQR